MANYVIQDAQVGFRINLQAFTTGTTPLSGSINTMVVVSPSGTRLTYPCQIDSTGQIAYYVLQGAEFPTSGPYRIQLQTQYGSNVFYSAVQVVQVQANL